MNRLPPLAIGRIPLVEKNDGTDAHTEPDPPEYPWLTSLLHARPFMT